MIQQKVADLITIHSELHREYCNHLDPVTLTTALLSHTLYLAAKYSSINMIELKEIYEKVWTGLQENKHGLGIKK